IGRFDLHALETLLAHGVDVEARDGDDRTPLYLAAKKGFVEAAAALLVAGAKVDSANGPEGDAPLAAAAVAAAPSLIENLLAHGADLRRRNAWAQTALFAAARGPSVHAEAVVPILLARGADVRVADRQGFTALHVAAAHDEVGTIRLLLRAGADPAVVSIHGSAPLDVALENHADLAAEALFDAGAPRRRSKLEPPLFQAAEADDTDWLLHILGAGFAADLRVDGTTALDRARSVRATDASRLLEAR
ncbi:MAG: ankyrin repeat domain-containing protein, partial [Polyangiaceae bacterium]